RSVGPSRRDAHGRRDLRGWMGLVGAGLRDHSAHRCDGGPGRTVSRRRRKERRTASTPGRRYAAARLGVRRVPVSLGGVRRPAVLPRRRRRLVHRPAVVVRREKSAGVGVAGGGRRPHLIARLRTPDRRARFLLELGTEYLYDAP